ncbi:MAG: polysaccharide export protein [Alphaproteobacteria bacterium]|jgi:polysaccharide export outer membrane protein|nr:polysaccharide export protein [Alphaproteobacteria bacterium]MBN9558685.1 polysaccharide export protein [Alphaproteobacteria bacterium]MBN9568441.1 polysaccharide export protein [Alphaproteobacteria bacterium]MBN9577842.1 polysaccharide export protein [Alphaproteobacteria bacterium]MBN9590959.1 polysaccharide export protein [Alphaproteobacteria bacterium]
MVAKFTSVIGGVLRRLGLVGAGAAVLILAGCAGSGEAPPPVTNAASQSEYLIGPGDSLQVFVWRNPDLSTTVPVRPDGRISIPLVEDIVAAGKTPTELARDLETRLKKYVTDPVVTVIVSNFVGASGQQIRVVGEAAQPKAVPYHAKMTVLDAMIDVGGLTPYASGNRATLVRTVNGKQTSYNIRLDDLLKDGDMSANAPLQPGDVIIIPQTYF